MTWIVRKPSLCSQLRVLGESQDYTCLKINLPASPVTIQALKDSVNIFLSGVRADGYATSTDPDSTRSGCDSST